MSTSTCVIIEEEKANSKSRGGSRKKGKGKAKAGDDGVAGGIDGRAGPRSENVVLQQCEYSFQPHTSSSFPLPPRRCRCSYTAQPTRFIAIFLITIDRRT